MSSADVLVVGSGGAGLAAALSAAVGGASVIVLERAPVFGGTTAVSGGGMWLPGNRFEQEQGEPDPPEEIRTYLRALTHGLVSESVLDSYIAHAADAFDFLERETDATLLPTFTPDYQSQLPGGRTSYDDGNSKPTRVGRSVAVGLYDSARLGEHKELLRKPSKHGGMWPAIEGESATGSAEGQEVNTLDVIRERRAKGILARGAALVSLLLEAGLAKGVKLELNCRAVRLLQNENGRVTGVVVEREGREVRFEARSGVVLASGGFEWNSTLWKSFIGTPLDGPLTPPGNEGDGQLMAARAGARLANFGNFGVWWMPAVQIPGEEYDGRPRLRTATNLGGRPGAIAVNRRGRRFGSEPMNYNDQGKLLTAFDPHAYDFVNYPAFVVMDADSRETFDLGYEYDSSPLINDSWMSEGTTLRELAGKLGVDAGGLEAQVAEFNHDAETGKDTVFGRGWRNGWESRPIRPLSTSGPYYGFQWKVGCYGTKCGPVTDERGQVVAVDGRPIPGLFAAGNAAAGIFGPAYPGRGGTLGPAVTFGYLAGRTLSA